MQPYEKFCNYGSASLSDTELLAVMIRTGTSQMSASAISQHILNLAGEEGLSVLYRLSLKEMMNLPGIGEVKAVQLKCITELAIRLARSRAQEKLQFHKPSSVAAYYMESMRHLDREEVYLILLDAKLRKLHELVVSIGTVSESMLSPREIFREALRQEAVNIILLHNHPSGDPTPSTQDIEITKRIQQIGQLMNIPLVDHIIIGDNSYRSFKEAGLL